MNSFGNDYISMMEHKIRQQELLERAENERNAKSLRTEVVRRVRRAIRINNNPLR